MKKAMIFLVFMALVLPTSSQGTQAAPTGPATQATGAASAAQPAGDPLQYEIWVSLDPAKKMLLGRETIRWTNTSRDAIPDVWFHLYWNAFKNEKSALMTEALREDPSGTFHGDTKVPDNGWGWIDVEKIRLADGTDLTAAMEFMTPDEPLHADDQTVMRVRLPRPLLPGETLELELSFKAKVPRTIRRSGYYHNGYFIGQWFPKPGVYQEGKGWNCHQYHLNSEFFADFARFRVHVTVPNEYVVGAAGKETARRQDAKGKTTTITFEQDRIHDFAWTADPDYVRIERDFIAANEVSPAEYREIAGTLRLPLEAVKLTDVKMILLINPEHRAQADRHFKALRTALKYYGLWYGAYPYAQVTLVDPPFRSGSGGMEYQTIFTAGTQVLPSPRANHPEMVIIHEFGHGYWYGLSASNEFEEAWLDEGINTYSTGKVIEKAYGPGAVPLTLFGIPLTRYSGALIYADKEADRGVAIQIVSHDPVVTAAWKFYDSMSYAMNVYMRASTNLHTLENLIGKEAMLRVMRAFHTRFRFRHPTSADFIATANEVSGRDMNWLFDELFFSTREWDYAVDSVRSREIKTRRGVFDENGKRTEITRRAARDLDRKIKKPSYLSLVRVRRLGEARPGPGVQLKIVTDFEDGTRKTSTWDGQGRWAEFSFSGPSKVKAVCIDPDNVFLIDRDLSNNSFIVKARMAGTMRWTTKLLFWIQNLLLFAGSLS
jgi:hypothetical protein